MQYYLTTLPYIDRKRICVIGQCAGAGYAVFASLTDRRIKAVCGGYVAQIQGKL